MRSSILDLLIKQRIKKRLPESKSSSHPPSSPPDFMSISHHCSAMRCFYFIFTHVFVENRPGGCPPAPRSPCAFPSPPTASRGPSPPAMTLCGCSYAPPSVRPRCMMIQSTSPWDDWRRRMSPKADLCSLYMIIFLMWWENSCPPDSVSEWRNLF